MAFCHYCDITALGCSGCDAPHTDLITHGHSRLLSAKTVLNETVMHLSAILLSDNSPCKASIEESLSNGTLSRFSRCLLSAAIQNFTVQASKQLGQEILPQLEKILVEDEKAKAEARKAAEEAAIERARIFARKAAEETATIIAKKVANDVAPPAAREAAIEVAQEVVSRKLQELDTKMELDDFISNQMGWLKGVSPAETKKCVGIAAKNAPAVIRRFKVPETKATQMPRLSLYDFLVLCDDSGSMNSDTRISTQESTVRGLFNILNALGSDRLFSVIPFVAPAHENLKTAKAVNSALESIRYKTGSNAIEPLERRIIRSLEKQAKSKSLSPTIVVVITDGDTGDVTNFANAIARFKAVLRENGYDGPAVLFLVCRVGSDQRAAEDLKELNRNRAIKDMVLYSEDQLDLKLANVGGNEDEYIGWVVGKLLDAMELQLI